MSSILDCLIGMGFLLAIIMFLRSKFYRSRTVTTLKTLKQKFDNKEIFNSAIKYRLSQGPVIAALGGGTGLSSLLYGLKAYTRNITAIVTVTDEGGSSGRLTRDWGLLPPGDIRNCIVALAENDNSLKNLLDFRFEKGELKGHSLGNLVLLAATELKGDFKLAVEELNNLLAIRGKVLPVTAESVCLAGMTREENKVRGELEITKHGSDIKTMWIEPRDAKPVKGVLSAIDSADLIVLGPGSLLTSVIPNLLFSQVAERIRKAHAPKIYVANLMTQPGETDGMSIVDHINWIEKALGQIPEYVIVNDSIIPDMLIKKYLSEGAMPLLLSSGEEKDLCQRGCSVIRGTLVKETQSTLLRHDGFMLSEILMRIFRNIQEV